ncbi:MAG TPA: class I SAM-dependent methyltransferase [Gemmatimonadaceae bacterium]|nr:class I SAM-dependent methyltransferase [Gemmatimonadaceae bacterium]
MPGGDRQSLETPSSAPEHGESPSDPNARLFDEHASSYSDTVNRSIALSGEDVAYFAQRKVDEVLRWMRAARVAAPARVLDFGCGTGISTAALGASLGPECAVTGVDVSAESVRTARELRIASNLRVVHGSGQSLPFDDASFDLAFTACVFHHIERGMHQHWMRELRRVVRPGGLTFLFEHNPLNPLTVRAVRVNPFDEGVELLRPRYARNLLASAGFVAERPRYYFFFPAALRALRPLEPWLERVPIGAQYFVAGRGQESKNAA